MSFQMDQKFFLKPTVESSAANRQVRPTNGLAINPTPHLNRARVKRTALELAAQIRPANHFTRVGMSFIERIEAKVRAAIREEVRIHPSKGKTLL